MKGEDAMGSHLVIRVHLHDRFHGMALNAPEWPPSPARLFQALLAGVAQGREVPSEMSDALEWLERLPPPRIGVPPSKLGSEVTLWVPNNDLDAKGGDPANVASIRTKKLVRPRLLEGDSPLLYVWSVEEEGPHVEAAIAAAEQLYQLGRGIDPAWAKAEMLSAEGLAALLEGYGGRVYFPGGRGGEATSLLCPVPGSLQSLVARFNAVRLETQRVGKKQVQLFQNAPRPFFGLVQYGRVRPLKVFTFLDAEDEAKPASHPLSQASKLVERVRDLAAARLQEALRGFEQEIDRVLIGRKADGSNGGPIEERIRILPLASVGHHQADHRIRRIAVEIPDMERLAVEDVEWAFDGLPIHDGKTGVITAMLAAEPDRSMLDHYTRPSSRFRSVTPVALPETSARRRIDPSRIKEEPKGAEERNEEESRARAAVRQALRHAGIHEQVVQIHVQREPFHRRGVLAERFADGTRFSKHRLWHVELTFKRKVEGPIVLGDGRFLGLGVMAPVRSEEVRGGIWAYAVQGPVQDPMALVRAFRRAVMSRVDEVRNPRRPLEPFFTGHSEDGKPVREAQSTHLAFQWEPSTSSLVIVAPHRLDRRDSTPRERRFLRELVPALEGLSELRAGRAGRFTLEPLSDGELERFDRMGTRFVSTNPYRVNRHGKNRTAHQILIEDVQAECRRRGLPTPRVTVQNAEGKQGLGLVGRMTLEFGTVVQGPLLLGRDRFLGGGLFLPENAELAAATGS